MRVNPAYAAVSAAIAIATVGALGIAAVGEGWHEREWRTLASIWAVLLCGSAIGTSLVLVASRRAAIAGYVSAAVAALTLAALLVGIWSDRLWDRYDEENVAKVLASGLALTLAGLLVVSLRLQLALDRRELAIAYIVVSTLVVLTAIYAVALLWLWDSPVGEGEGGRRIEDVATRALLALFALSVAGYLITPLLERALPRYAARSRR